MAVTVPNSMLPAAAPTTAAPNDARARLANNFETFLTLLTTQLKNQDPLSPMDGNQFTQQLVQMTGVEQQLQANDLLKKLVSQGEAAPVSLPGGIELIGKTVAADKSTMPLTATGASWDYELPVQAKAATVKVLNAKGEVVYSGAAPKTEAGRHSFVWDGKTASGTAPAGDYTLKIEAFSAGGADIRAPVGIVGLVTAAELVDGQTWLTVGKSRVKLETITSVRQTV